MMPMRANIVGPPARRRLGGFQSGGLSKFMRDAIARRSALRLPALVAALPCRVRP